MTRGVMGRLGLAAMVVLIAASCGETSAPTPHLSLSACTVQTLHAQCGTLAVPENPAQPGGRTIHLRVVVLPATSERAPDPLFYFEGGPGGSATDEAMWVASHFFLFNQHHDIVLIDQRGTGKSNQALCAAPEQTSGTEAETAAAVQSCLDQIKDRADPTFYTTPISVDDFHRVRSALGYDKIDIYGVSYGVSTGLAYVQRHGEHVRAALFDSGSMLDFHIWEQVPHSAQQSLERLFDRCEATTDCAAAFPNLGADFAKIVKQATDAPVSDINANTLMNVIISGYLGITRNAASLPKDIHAAARGDWAGIAQTVKDISQGDHVFSAMSITVRCSDEWASHSAPYQGSPFSAFEGRFLSELTTVCKYWPHGPGAAGRVMSTAPIVFLNSTADPADPPENVASAAADMPNSLVVPVAGFGHWQLDADITRCLDDEAVTFLEAGRKSSLSQWSCATSPLLPAFVIN